MNCPDLDWLILSTSEKIMILFSLFEILLLPNLLVFWRSRVSPIINLLVLTGLILVDFDRLRQLSCRVLQGWLTTHSQLEIFLTVGKPLKLILCSNKVMQATHLIIVCRYSLTSIYTLILLNVTFTILCMTFFNWTTWFILDSPVFVQHGF